MNSFNAYRWARENLSEPRARAFEKAFRLIDGSKWSDEYHQERRKEEEIKIAFYRSKLEQTNEIEKKAYQEADELEKQAHELMKKAQQLRTQAREEVSRIQGEVYDTEEHKAQRAKVSALWHRDNDAIQPQIQALMEKYLKAQKASLKA